MRRRCVFVDGFSSSLTLVLPEDACRGHVQRATKHRDLIACNFRVHCAVQSAAARHQMLRTRGRQRHLATVSWDTSPCRYVHRSAPTPVGLPFGPSLLCRCLPRPVLLPQTSTPRPPTVAPPPSPWPPPPLSQCFSTTAPPPPARSMRTHVGRGGGRCACGEPPPSLTHGTPRCGPHCRVAVSRHEPRPSRSEPPPPPPRPMRAWPWWHEARPCRRSGPARRCAAGGRAGHGRAARRRRCRRTHRPVCL